MQQSASPTAIKPAGRLRIRSKRRHRLTGKRYLATRESVVRLVGNVIYPGVIQYLRDEIRPDVASASGTVEALAWKVHSYIVLNEELRPRGEDCAPDGLPCNRETRARILDVVLRHAVATKGDVFEFGVHEGESLVLFAFAVSFLLYSKIP